VRKARNGSTCTAPIADLGTEAAPGVAANDEPGAGGRLDLVKDPVTRVAGAVAGAASGLGDRITEGVEGSPLDDPFVLTIVGLFLLLITFMGTLLLAQIVRTMGIREE